MSASNRVNVIVLPDSGGDVRAGGASTSRVILLGEVLFHREALARALGAYEDIALIGSVADVHAALILADERDADILLVDSPSVAVAQMLASQAFGCEIVVVGAAGDGSRELQNRGAALFVGASSSLAELHVALRFAHPREVARRLPPIALPQLGWDAKAILTLREQQICWLVSGGSSNKEIAASCGISVATVKNHVHRILRKLNLRRRAQIARLSADRPPRSPLT